MTKTITELKAEAGNTIAMTEKRSFNDGIMKGIEDRLNELAVKIDEVIDRIDNLENPK